MFSATSKKVFLIIANLKVVINKTKGRRLKPEQIVNLLSQIDGLTMNGKILVQAFEEVGKVEQGFVIAAKSMMM